MSEFTKHDVKKNRVELIEPSFIAGIGWVLTFGAEKYGVNNWKLASDEDIERVKGALMRHLLAYMDGELIDPESGKPHLWHIGTNTMFLDYYEREKGYERAGATQKTSKSDTR